jgi:Zn-dependent protease/predicted transcriptional regulator
MRESIRLGRVAGVPVGVNWSLLAIFLLLAVGLSAGRLPDAHPGLSTPSYVAVGVGTAILFFVSILLHEVAHAIVATRSGVGVEGIVLWLFGGVAKMEGDAPTPGAAFRIAVAGPLTSVALGLVFLAISAMYGDLGLPGLVGDGARWLGIINLVLAAFNMVPGAPLDGGRALRAVLWSATGDRDRSGVLAARAGRVVGYVVIALGVLQFATLGVGGLWLVLIGWFLLSAARVEESHAELRGVLGEVPVSQLMTPDPVTVRAGTSVQDFLEGHVFRHRFSTFPVVDEVGRPVGLVTVSRVKAVPADRWPVTTVEAVASPIDQVGCARPDEPVVDALERLGADGDGRILVLSGEQLVGIVSPVDVVRSMELASLRRHAHAV